MATKTGFTVRLEGDRRILRKLSSRPINERQLNDFLGKIGAETERIWKTEAPTDTGRYKNSIAHQLRTRALQVIIQARVKYAIYIETGQRRHFPPIKAISGWARRHGLNPYAVARSIARKGVDKNPVLRRTINRMRPRIRVFVRQLGRDIQRNWGR